MDNSKSVGAVAHKMSKRGLTAIFVSALMFSGCATVTQLSGGQSDVVSITQEQSALRQASEHFSETAASRGWIAESGGLFDLARLLVDGQSEAPIADTERYGELIGLGVRSETDVYQSLTSDIVDASGSLSAVSDIAEAFLTVIEQQKTERADLMAFERALVNAQKCRRTFLSVTVEIGSALPVDTEAALSDFDVQIDRARDLADQLAADYSGRRIGATS